MNARLPQGADIVVIGGGVVGASTAFYLAEALAGRIALLECGRVAGAATSRAAGIVRALHDDDVETRLALLSHTEFDRWADRVGGSCGYADTGFLLMLGEGETEPVKGRIAQWRSEGLNAELLSPDRIRELYPPVDTQGLGGALYEPRGGSADPVETTLSYLAAATRLGVQVREGVRVLGIDTDRGRATGVTTAEGRIRCDTVVVASGVGACQLLPPIGVHIPLLPVRMSTGQIVAPDDLDLPITFVGTVTDTFYRPNRWPGVVNISMRDDRHNTTADLEHARDHEPVDLDCAAHRDHSSVETNPFNIERKTVPSMVWDRWRHPRLSPSTWTRSGPGRGSFSCWRQLQELQAGTRHCLALADEILQRKPQIDLEPLSAVRFDGVDDMSQAPSHTLRSVL